MQHANGICVLIVDDDSLVCDVIESELAKAGYFVLARALNGDQALALLESLEPDVILLDIAMPGISGLETARRILAHRSIPIILLTAHDERRFVTEGIEIGISGFLIKPPKSRELDRAILIALSRHRELLNLRRTNLQFHDALDRAKVLHGLLQICGYCKRIKNDKGEWQKIEQYLKVHSEASFSHGICPDCLQEHHPRIAEKVHPTSKDLPIEEHDSHEG